MKKSMRKITLLMALFMLAFGMKIPLFAESTAFYTENASEDAANGDIAPEDAPTLSCVSAILMEESTGKILYAKNANEALPPASVTKVMTLLLIMEAIEAGQIHMDDTVSVSANAASMGGSQVYLKEGEKMPLEDLLKSVVIASANDAAVALAEHLCGSVETFVSKMNQRAKQLGMKQTTFENVTGLDDTAQNHLTSAHDIAVMSRELISHKDILQYSSIWMDTIRDGAFGLTNTNRLVRYYQGCTGLKTGSTEKAGFCVSATAKRDHLSLICVIMGAKSRDVRNAEASSLLDWGFSTYTLFSVDEEQVGEVEVVRGVTPRCSLASQATSYVVEKGDLKSITSEIVLPDSVNAPVKVGDIIGKRVFSCNGEVLGTVPVYATVSINVMDFFEILKRMAASFLLI